MWTTAASRETTATKQQIWNLWVDVKHWNSWDKDVESAELLGSFELGAKGQLKPVGGPKTVFTLVECSEYKSFTSRSFLPLCKMDFIHLLEETDNGLEITHKIEMTGFLTFFFARVIGRKINAGLPLAVENLVRLAASK
jgi:hypothetical protein